MFELISSFNNIPGEGQKWAFVLCENVFQFFQECDGEYDDKKDWFQCHMGFPSGSDCNESACNAGDPGLIPGSGRSSGEGNGYPVFLPGEFHGQRSLAGYSPWGHKESDMTEMTDTFTLKSGTVSHAFDLLKTGT